MRNYFLLFIFIISENLVCADDDIPANRVLLPYSINSYQPTLLPVVTIDGSKMYLDRKWHPFNQGEGLDSDDIWVSHRLQGDYWGEPVNVEKLNTTKPDVLFAITPDNSTALLYGSYLNDDEGFYLAERSSGDWKIHSRLKIIDYYNNWDQYGGSLSHDKKILILALNREDSRGGLDLYISFLNKKAGFWSAPKSLGKTINTHGIEAAPFLSYDNKTLYFASNGHGGFGKLDLFKATRLDDTWENWSKPINLSSIFNSEEDENSIWITALADSAYIASYDTINDRSAIYSVVIPDSLKPEPYYILHGNVYFLDNDPGVYTLTIETISGERINTFNSSDEKFYTLLPAKGKYRITASEPGHETYSFILQTELPQNPEYIERDIVFKPIAKPTIIHKTIYFKFNDAILSNDAKQKLSNQIFSLDRADAYRFIITGHADELGSDEYNTELSYKRAKNTEYFLIDSGIDKSDISVKWEGERNSISSDHAKNRRVEISIIPK
jgi:OmpA-OmpF porin, OOP family